MTTTGVPAGPSTPNSLVDQVLAQAPNAQVALAMLMGSHLEGGWGPSWGVGDAGTSFGPFQIHLPAHPGVTPAEASDPRFAVAYMLPAYEQAVAKVGNTAFRANPLNAGEAAAVSAERPAEPYFASQGATAVDNAYQAAKAILEGNAVSGSSTSADGAGAGGGSYPGTGASTTSLFSLVTNPVGSIETAGAYLLLVGASIGLIIAGAYRCVSPNVSFTQRVASAKPDAQQAAETAAIAA